MRRDVERLDDVAEAIGAIRRHLGRGPLSDGLVFDAVRARLSEIGEAVKAVPTAMRAAEPEVDRRAIARFRDQLTHRYWDTVHGIVQQVVDHDLDVLEAAVLRLRQE